MQSLYKPKSYPAPMRSEILAMSQTAIEVANRWMLGWPETVKGLIESGEFLEALKNQEQEEIRIKMDNSLSHLSSWEKNEVMGLSAAPPSPSEPSCRF
jgi:hypothetical protein